MTILERFREIFGEYEPIIYEKATVSIDLSALANDGSSILDKISEISGFLPVIADILIGIAGGVGGLPVPVSDGIDPFYDGLPGNGGYPDLPGNGGYPDFPDFPDLPDDGSLIPDIIDKTGLALDLTVYGSQVNWDYIASAGVTAGVTMFFIGQVFYCLRLLVRVVSGGR
jgi:hypothetical protein